MIPVIDLSDYLSGRAGALERTAADIRLALTHAGFFMITGHDVPSDLIARTFAEARRLFALPMAEKLAMRMNNHNNGYFGDRIGADQPGRPRYQEGFFIKRERPADHPLRLSGRRFTGPNIWPEEDVLPGFRARILEYYACMDDFTNRLLPAVAVALELDPGFFTPHFVDSQSNMRLSHYAAIPAGAEDCAASPHIDGNFMTFLPRTEVPGLQMRTCGGVWLNVPDIPNAFAVNCGAALHRWSNGFFPGTMHRALQPTERDRYVIPFFQAPRLDSEIACLPSRACQGDTPKWAPISYEDYCHQL